MDRLLTGVTLVVYVAYFLLGNFARPGKMLPTGGLPVLEAALVSVSVVTLLRTRTPVPIEFKILGVAFVASSVVGYLQHGLLSVLPAAYAFRVGAILLTSVAVAYSILARRLEGPDGVVRLTVNLLLMQAGIGWVILLAFPNSSRLWASMERLGLGFPGDPHQNRLLGPLLDPNYFGNLLVLGTALTGAAVVQGRARWAIAAYSCFIASLLMTVSRSSMLGFAVWMLTFIVLRTMHGEKLRGTWRRWLALGAVTGLVGLLMGDTVGRLASRIYTTMSSGFDNPWLGIVIEPSAAHRLGGFIEAAARLMDARILVYGLGYNFLPLVSRSKYVLSGYDASLVNLLLTLGFPLAMLVSWTVRRWVRRAYLTAFARDPILADSLLGYLIAAVAMSFFNNLLFYTPFVLMVAVILSAFVLTADRFAWRSACMSNQKGGAWQAASCVVRRAPC